MASVNDFRAKAIRELKKIKIAWPGLDCATPAGALEQYEQRRLVGRLRQDLERSQDGDLSRVKRRIELRKQDAEWRLVKIREKIGNAQEGAETRR